MTATKVSYGKIGKISLDVGSPAYAFDGVQTTEIPGCPVPVIYGEHKVSGNIINQFVYNDGTKNYLSSLLAVCEGEIESMSNHRINGIALAKLSGSSVVTKMGTNSQAVIPYFNDQHFLYEINEQIDNAEVYDYTTVDSDVEAIELNFSMPNGLYVTDSKTFKTSQFIIELTIQTKLHSGSTWTTISQTYKNLSTANLSLKVRIESLSAGQYDVRITKVTRIDNPGKYKNPIRVSTLVLESIDEIKTDDLAHPNTALAGYRLLSIEQLNGSTPTYEIQVKGKKVLIPDVKYSGASVPWADYYWNPASSQYKRFSDNAVCTWDGVTYVSEWSANPVWCIKDLILSSRYGLGEYMDSSMIDTSTFLEMSRYCDEKVSDGAGGYEKRFSLDVVLDSQFEAVDVLAQLLATCRGHVFYSEGLIKIRINRPGTAVGFFGMGSIIKGSFKQRFKPISEVPNIVEVTYNDDEKDWSEETVEYIDEESLVAGDPVRRESLRIFLTRTSQALREARYYLKNLKYTKRTITFNTGINASGLEVGDVLAISHDVPGWGYSGRIKSGSTSTNIKLDRDVIITAGTGYKLLVMFRDTDTIEEATVTTSTDGRYTELTVTGLSKAPSVYDEYSFGVSGINYKPFRCSKITEKNTNEFTIEATEYNDLVYDDSAIILPDSNYSVLSNEIPLVTDLTLSESIAKTKDGKIENFINVYFQCPSQSDTYLRKFSKAKIYIQEEDGAFILRGQVDYPTGFFQIIGGLNDLVNYTVAIVSVDNKGKETSIDDSPQETILVQGKTAKPESVTGFNVSQEASVLKFSWSANTEVDFSRYIVKKGTDWASGVVINELVDATSFVYPVSEIGPVTYMVKAVDTSGNESESPAIDTIVVVPPPSGSFMNLYYIWGQNIEYKLSNLSLEATNLFDPSYSRNVLSLTSQKTWEELEAEGGTWESKESSIVEGASVELSGSYEQINPFDLETVFPFKIISDPDYLNAANGTLTLQISYSLDGTTFTSFADVDPDETYKARYVKFKILISTSNANYNFWLYDYKIYVHAPSIIVDWGADIPVPIGGKTISFASTFSAAPKVVASIVNGILGVVKISNKTTTSFDVMCYNLSGSAISTAEIDWEARGY